MLDYTYAKLLFCWKCFLIWIVKTSVTPRKVSACRINSTISLNVKFSPGHKGNLGPPPPPPLLIITFYDNVHIVHTYIIFKNIKYKRKQISNIHGKYFHSIPDISIECQIFPFNANDVTKGLTTLQILIQ